MSLLSAPRSSRSEAKEGSEPSRSGRAGSGSTVGPLAMRPEPESQARPWKAERLALVEAGAPWVIQRKCAACAEEEQALQRRAKPGALDTPEEVPAVVGEVLRSSGRALDASARAYFEPRFGRTFDDVRIHDDAQADASARAVSAVAYTVGRDVVFRRGSFAPETAEGKELLAHELAHVVQQSGRAGPAGRGGALTIGAATDPAEREADRTAEKVVRGELGGATTARATADALQRREVCDEEGICWSEDENNDVSNAPIELAPIEIIGDPDAPYVPPEGIEGEEISYGEAAIDNASAGEPLVGYCQCTKLHPAGAVSVAFPETLSLLNGFVPCPELSQDLWVDQHCNAMHVQTPASGPLEPPVSPLLPSSECNQDFIDACVETSGDRESCDGCCDNVYQDFTCNSNCKGTCMTTFSPLPLDDDIPDDL